MSRSKPSALSDLAAAVTAGLHVSIQRIIVYPLEIIKLLYQHQAHFEFGSGTPLQILSQRIHSQGLISTLYSGFSFAVIRTMISNVFNFVFQGRILALFPPANPKSDRLQKGLRTVIVGTFPAMTLLTFAYPFDTLVDLYSVKRPESLGGLISTLSSRSELPNADLLTRALPIATALYAGFPISVVGINSYRICYFLIFDWLNQLFKRYNTNTGAWKISFGFGASLVAGLVTYPFDSIRRYQMIAALQGGDCSAWTAAERLMARGGVLGLFDGAWVNVLRAVLSISSLIAYDSLLTRSTSWLKRRTGKK